MKTKPLCSLQTLARLCCLVLLGGGALCCGAALLLAGGLAGLLQFLPFALAFCLCLLGSGLFCLRRLAPQLTGADSVVLAFLPGCACVFGGYALIWALGGWLAFLRSPGWYLLPTWLLGLWELAARLRRRKAVGASPRKAPAAEWLLLAAVVGVLLAIFAVWGVLPQAQAQRLVAWTYNQDQLWSVGNAAAVQFGLPLQDVRIAGQQLHYYYFNDVMAGLLALGTGSTAWAGACWYWDLLILPMAALGLFCAGRRLAPQKPWLAALVPALVFLASPSGSTLPTNLFTNDNAFCTALLALSAGVLLIVHAPRQATAKQAFAWLLVCFLAGAALAMLKGTVALLLLLALLSALAVGALTRQAYAGHLVTLAGLGGAFALVYLCLLRFATNNLVFTSFSALAKLPQAYRRHFTLPVLLAYAAALVYHAVHLRKLPVATLTVNAFAIGGMLAYVLYSHYSYSQVYFALGAVPCVAYVLLGAGQALAQRLSALPRPFGGRVAALLLAAVFAVCAGSQLYAGQNYLRAGAQAALRCLGLSAYPAEETRMTAEDEAAAEWLRDNTALDAVFATNRNNRQFTAADGIFHYYTAVSQRRCYIESYRYGMDYDAAYWEIRRRLEQVSDNIFYQLSEEDAFALARDEGVDYLLVSLLVPDAPAWSAEPVYQNAFVRIYATAA